MIAGHLKQEVKIWENISLMPGSEVIALARAILPDGRENVIFYSKVAAKPGTCYMWEIDIDPILYDCLPKMKQP
jgi:hypothetical protein